MDISQKKDLLKIVYDKLFRLTGNITVYPLPEVCMKDGLTSGMLTRADLPGVRGFHYPTLQPKYHTARICVIGGGKLSVIPTQYHETSYRIHLTIGRPSRFLPDKCTRRRYPCETRPGEKKIPDRLCGEGPLFYYGCDGQIR
jgi:hypothetical protein